MNIRIIVGAFAALAAGALTPAQAQTSTLLCRYDDLYQVSRSNGEVSYESVAGPDEDIEITLDFGAGAFDMAGTPGNFTSTPDRLIAVAADDVNHGVIEIDRRDGRVRITVVTAADAGEAPEFSFANGQCRTANGATSF